jgi:hypothetical protein
LLQVITPAISFTEAKEAGLLDTTKIERFAIMYLAIIDEIKGYENWNYEPGIHGSELSSI